MADRKQRLDTGGQSISATKRYGRLQEFCENVFVLECHEDDRISCMVDDWFAGQSQRAKMAKWTWRPKLLPGSLIHLLRRRRLWKRNSQARIHSTWDHSPSDILNCLANARYFQFGSTENNSSILWCLPSVWYWLVRRAAAKRRRCVKYSVMNVHINFMNYFMIIYKFSMEVASITSCKPWPSPSA